MNDATLRLAYVLTDLVAPLACGYLFHQKGILGNEAINRLIKLNVRGIYTCLSLLSFWVLPLSWDLAWLPVFGFLYVLLPGAVGLPFARRHRHPRNRGAYLLSAMLSNIGTLGGVCAFILYNETGFAYAQIMGTCQNVMLVLVCFPVAQYFHNQVIRQPMRRTSPWQTFRDMFLSWNQLSLLGMTGGLALNASGIARPDFLAPVFQSLVHIGAWTALLPVGFMINFQRARFYYAQALDLIALRFLVVPGCIWGAGHLVFSDPVLLNCLFLLATAPTAINAVLAARIYKLNVDFTVASFLLTTTLYLFLIFPALFFLLR